MQEKVDLNSPADASALVPARMSMKKLLMGDTGVVGEIDTCDSADYKPASETRTHA